MNSKIYFGGSIITMENENDSPEAILIEDGKIKKTGTLEDMKKISDKKAELIDLQGKCLMPSFIDAHGHITMNGQMALCANLSECTSFNEIIETLRDYIEKEKLTSRHALMGFGYDHNFLDEQAQPSKIVLDQVSTEIPIMILHVSGHLCCVNSPALNLAGISDKTPEPQGGHIGRISGSTEPDGYLEESAMTSVQMVISKHIKKDVSKILNEMQKIYVENGVTTVQDGATTKETLQLLKIANKLGKLDIDVVSYLMMNSDGHDILQKNASYDGKYKKHLKIGGYKLVLDGSPQGRSAWMSEPYLGGEAGYCGYPWMPDEEVNNYVLQAINDNRQILVHCNGDAAGDQYLNAYSKALEESSNPSKYTLRPVMIHCQTARNDQLDRMAELKMIASIFVGHVYYWGDVHMKNFGPERGNHISPAKDALDRNISVNFHQDTPVTKPKMLHSVWCAVNRLSRSGKVIGENQKIPVYDALKAVTINAAFEYFEEDSKGSLKEGKRADIVILDRNPLDVPPLEIKDIQILETIKDGKTIYKK